MNLNINNLLFFLTIAFSIIALAILYFGVSHPDEH